jgi:hypothetical protein
MMWCGALWWWCAVSSIERCIEELKNGRYLPAHTCKLICERLSDMLLKESNVRPIRSPVTVVGDVHGQFYDVLELFKIGGDVPHTNYLFLGDYVDRGYFSVETISLLACLKLRYPDRVTLIRGNHESRTTTLVLYRPITGQQSQHGSSPCSAAVR